MLSRHPRLPGNTPFSRSRRRLLAMLPGAVLIAGGVACGDDDDESDGNGGDGQTTEPTTDATSDATTDATATASETTGSASPSATVESAGESTGYPRTVQHRLGTTEIPAKPERVLAVNDGEALDHLLAIGVTPVLFGQTAGYDGTGRVMPWVEDAAGGALESYEMTRMEPDLEQMAAATPDLIVGAWIPEDQYQLMSGIAPTIIIKDSDAVAWPEMQRTVAEALDMMDEAEAALAETDEVIAQGAQQLQPYADRKVTIGYKFTDVLFIHGANTPIGRLVTRLGLEVEAPNPDELTELSLERIGDLQNADILLSPAFFVEDQEAFEADPLMQALPAVQEGRYVPLPVDLATAGYWETTLSVRWAIPVLVDAIVQAAEGQGKIV